MPWRGLRFGPDRAQKRQWTHSRLRSGVSVPQARVKAIPRFPINSYLETVITWSWSSPATNHTYNYSHHHHCSTAAATIPEGRPVMSDVSPLSGILGLSFGSTLLFPVLFFGLVLLRFLSYLFTVCRPILLNFFQKRFHCFSLKGRLFCMAPV